MLSFLESVFGSLLPEHGIPAALRRLYEVTGAAKSVHHAHNEIVAPGRIDFADDHLVFYEENQGVVVWGIARAALSLDDPPVDQGQHDHENDTRAFYPEFTSVSEFACAQGAWQAVQGGLAYCGVKDDFPHSHFENLLGPPALTTEGMKAWLVEGGVAIAVPDKYIGLATHTAAQFESASTNLGLTIDAWDWATLQDEE